MNELSVTILPISEITPYAGNAKKHPPRQIKQIMASIRQFGMNDPISVWGENNLIVEGHGRLLALQKLGYDTAPVLRLDRLSDEERRAYTLAHNQLTMNTGFDTDALNAELDAINADMTVFGFEARREDAVCEDDFNGKTPRKALTERGDVWLLGRHRLLCGDCADARDLDALFDGATADLLLTGVPNPPSADDAERNAFYYGALAAADARMKPGACFYLFHDDAASYPLRGACRCVNWQVRQCLIWHQDGERDASDGYATRHMPCLYGWKDGTHLWASNRKQTTVLRYAKPPAARGVETKPVLLMDYLMQNNTKGGDIVFDPFSGGGECFIAADQNGRTAYGCEESRELADCAVARYATWAGEETVRRVRGGETVPLPMLIRKGGESA